MDDKTVELRSSLYSCFYARLKEHRTYLHKYALTSGRGYNKENFIIMDYHNNDDIALWCEIINAAYSDADYSPETARELLNNHPAVTGNKTAFYIQNGKRVATISYGQVRTSEQAGAFFRIAVLPEFQGQGIGRKLLCFAEGDYIRKE